MTLVALALVIAAALVHASWNFLLKRSGGGSGLITAASALSIAIYAPIAAFAAWCRAITSSGPGRRA